jgi:hypothetical protein
VTEWFNPFPGVAPLSQEGPRAPGPPAPVSREPQIMWRPQVFRLLIAPLVVTPFFATRSLVVALEIYAEITNTTRVLVGNKLITSSLTSGDGIPGNNYFQLDPGRHAYIATDRPETEVFDVGMYFATQETAATNQYLHCTMWQAQAIAGPR